MIRHETQAKEIGTEVPLGISDKLILEFNGRRHVLKNMIVDEGLRALRNTSIDSLISHIGFVSKTYNPGWQITSEMQSFNVASEPFDFLPPGHPDGPLWGQNSWLEGWSSSPHPEPVPAPFVAPDFSYIESTRDWLVTKDSSLNIAKMVGYRGRGYLEPDVVNPEGGSSQTAYVADDPSLATANGFVERDNINVIVLASSITNTAWRHTIGTLWSAAYLRDEQGNAIIVDLSTVDQLRVFYTIRLHLPIIPVVQVVDGITCTTRAYNAGAVHSAFNHGSPYSFAAAFESNVMPALNAGQIGASVNATTNSTFNPPGQLYSDRTHEWTPGSANFASGVGSIVYHGILPAGPRMITTFEPKLNKTDQNRLLFQTRYSYTNISGA